MLSVFHENLSLYRGRISISFSKLFENFSIRDVLASIHKLGLFNNIFALDYAMLAEHFSVFDHLEHLTAYQKKLVFFEFIYAHLCHRSLMMIKDIFFQSHTLSNKFPQRIKSTWNT